MKQLKPHWYKFFASHGWWARFTTNVLKWPQFKHRFISWKEIRRKKKMYENWDRMDHYLSPPVEALVSPHPAFLDTAENHPYHFSIDDDYWKRKEIGLGFNPELEQKLKSEGVRPTKNYE